MEIPPEMNPVLKTVALGQENGDADLRLLRGRGAPGLARET